MATYVISDIHGYLSRMGPHLVARGKSHGFPRVAAGTWVYSRVTTGMPILNGSLLVKSGHLSRYDGHLGKLN